MEEGSGISWVSVDGEGYLAEHEFLLKLRIFFFFLPSMDVLFQTEVMFFQLKY